jgi:hypothetical protein
MTMNIVQGTRDTVNLFDLMLLLYCLQVHSAVWIGSILFSLGAERLSGAHCSWFAALSQAVQREIRAQTGSID